MKSPEEYENLLRSRNIKTFKDLIHIDYIRIIEVINLRNVFKHLTNYIEFSENSDGGIRYSTNLPALIFRMGISDIFGDSYELEFLGYFKFPLSPKSEGDVNNNKYIYKGKIDDLSFVINGFTFCPSGKIYSLDDDIFNVLQYSYIEQDDNRIGHDLSQLMFLRWNPIRDTVPYFDEILKKIYNKRVPSNYENFPSIDQLEEEDWNWYEVNKFIWTDILYPKKEPSIISVENMIKLLNEFNETNRTELIFKNGSINFINMSSTMTEFNKEEKKKKDSKKKIS